MKRSLGLAIGSAALAVCVGMVAQVVAQSGSFKDVTDVVAIEVPVQVIKDGDPVSGLTAADFAIVDGVTALRRREQTGNQIGKGGFARTRRPGDGNHFAKPALKIDPA